MAMNVNVAGAALVRVDYGSGLVDFGYTQDGVRITTEGHAINVPGDQNGGDEGPPIEIQYLGETARVRLELTKWDIAVGNQLSKRAVTATVGTPGTAGTLVFANGYYVRLVIAAVNSPWNFPCATLVRTPFEINVGTKYARLIMEFECYKHPVSGVLYNTATA